MPIFLLLILVALPINAQAQITTPAVATNPAATGPSEGLLKPEQLEAIVAPIALYPDALLAQVLIASTYPLEVVHAERWAAQNTALKGDALRAALAKETWDDSVKSLVPTPSVLVMMSKELDWTRKLGDAVLAQEAEVMDAVQRLRARAQAGDKLTTTKEQKVTAKVERGKQIIAIEAASPSTVYVPYYDPAIVYGTWPYPEYPPYYYYPADYYIPGTVIATGIAFGAAYAWWRWSGGWGNINWGGGRLDFHRGAHVEHWRHNPRHRGGVAYNNPNVRQKFAASSAVGDRAKRTQLPAADRAKQAGKAGTKQVGQGGTKQARKSGGKQASKGKGSAAKNQSARAKSTGQAKKSAQARRTQQHRSGSRSAPRRSQTVTRVSHNSMAQRGRSGARSFGGGGRSFGGGGRGGGRGRRSDIRLKHDIVLLARFSSGLGWYRFVYNGGTTTYVGVMAQEVRLLAPWAVMRGQDGYLAVDYDKLGLKFQTYEEWRNSLRGNLPELMYPSERLGACAREYPERAEGRMLRAHALSNSDNDSDSLHGKACR